MIHPPLIFQLAQEAGFLYELECHVVKKAVGDMARLRRALGRPLKACVNVTVPTFYDDAFEAFLRQLLADGDVGWGDLCLEISEHQALFIGSEAEVEEKSQRIRAMGFSLAIDDFSMGHTSLKYLQSNAFDMVKLDGSLVRELMDNPCCGEIVTAIVALSRALGFTVLGECVETAEQQLLLEELGCRHYQGYLYSPALPLEELIGVVRHDGIILTSLSLGETMSSVEAWFGGNRDFTASSVNGLAFAYKKDPIRRRGDFASLLRGASESGALHQDGKGRSIAARGDEPSRFAPEAAPKDGKGKPLAGRGDEPSRPAPDPDRSDRED